MAYDFNDKILYVFDYHKICSQMLTDKQNEIMLKLLFFIDQLRITGFQKCYKGNEMECISYKATKAQSLQSMAILLVK